MENNNYKKLYWLLGIIFLVWMLFYLIEYSSSLNWTDLGQIGDSFGALNTLFSGLAFAGVIYTILLQHKELGLQREELKTTREVLKRSAEAQEKSEDALNRQINEMNTSSRINLISAIVALNSLKTDVVEIGLKATTDGMYIKQVNEIIEKLHPVISDELRKISIDI